MTPDDRYAANFTLLQQAVPAMAQAIAQVPLTNVMLIPGEAGHLLGHVWDVATQQWLALCASHTPDVDAARDVDQFWSETPRVFTLLGFGLGHFAAAFARKLLPWQRLIICELSPSLFKAALYATDLAPLIAEGKRVELLVGDALDASLEHTWLNLAVDEKMGIATPMRAGHTEVHMREAYERLGSLVVDYMRHHAVGLATWAQFGRNIGENDAANLPEYLSVPGLDALKDLWQGKPAVCIAAGPSLHRNLVQLCDATVRPHLAVLTVGTCYALVQGLGLAPDVVTSIDFQPLNHTDQFQYVPLDPACPLVYLHSIYPTTIRAWPGPRIVAGNASDFTGWLKAYAEPKMEASIVQTVAHLNVMTAVALGCDPIILLGQDLAMPQDLHHAAGARAQDATPGETPEAFLDATDYAGEPTQTRHSFLTMKQTFERLVRLYPDANLINCTEGGLALDGIPNQPLAEVLAPFRTSVPPPVPLRHLIGQACQHYKPQTRWADVWHDLHAARVGLEACTAWARQIAGLWGDPETGPSDDTPVPTILALQGDLGQFQMPYALMACRRYDFMRAMGVPPPATYAQDQPAIDRYNAGRVARTARMILEEVAGVTRTLDATLRRLDDVLSFYEERRPFVSCRELMTLMARQSWAAVEARLTLGWPDDVSPALATRILLQLAWHHQCYEEVVRLTTFCPHPRKRALALARLHQYRQAVATAMPHYLHAPVQPPAPVPPAPLDQVPVGADRSDMVLATLGGVLRALAPHLASLTP